MRSVRYNDGRTDEGHWRTKAIAGTGEVVTSFSTTGKVRNDIVNLGKFGANALTDEDSVLYSVQKTKDGSVAYAKILRRKDINSLWERRQ